MKFTNMLIATAIALTSASSAFAGSGDVKRSTAKKYVVLGSELGKKQVTTHLGETITQCPSITIERGSKSAHYNVIAKCYYEELIPQAYGGVVKGYREDRQNFLRTDQLFELTPPQLRDAWNDHNIGLTQTDIGDLYRAKKGWTIKPYGY